MDAQLVSALYRTHKYLPASNKISSLYVFDALARAAKHQAVKHGMSVNVDKGNSATFMLKLEGILEDLFVDLSSATVEVPELKVRKLFVHRSMHPLIEISLSPSCSPWTCFTSYVCSIRLLVLDRVAHRSTRPWLRLRIYSTIISMWSICRLLHTGQDEKSIGLVVQKLYVSSAYAGEAEGHSQ